MFALIDWIRRHVRRTKERPALKVFAGEAAARRPAPLPITGRFLIARRVDCHGRPCGVIQLDRTYRYLDGAKEVRRRMAESGGKWILLPAQRSLLMPGCKVLFAPLED